jgi:hypothetical protein
MDTDTTPVEKKGISRRAVIVGGATGAAAFWSVPVIDSVMSRAAAASGCEAPGSLTLSGAGLVYKIGTTIFWVAFGTGTAGCTTSLPNDSDFAAPVNVCSAWVQITGGIVLYGSTSAVTEPTLASNTTCSDYFKATAHGITITQDGLNAGVVPLVYLFHNGNWNGTGCQTYGSKGHWALACGATNPNCGQSGHCIS